MIISGDRTTGDIYALVIPNTTGEVLKSVIEAITEPSTPLCTDPFAVYRCIDRDHQWVNHRKKQWAKGEVHMSGIERFWAKLKDALAGKHLNRYVQQFTGK